MVAGFLAEGALIGQVSSQLVQLLSLRSWIFQYGVAGLSRPARLQRDGSVTFGQLRWAADGEGLPAEGDVELLVESGGSFRVGSHWTAARVICDRPSIGAPYRRRLLHG